MGYWPLGLLEAATSLFLTALLFAGPLYERLFIDGAWHAWLRLEPLNAVWSDWPSWRNFVAVCCVRLSHTLFDQSLFSTTANRELARDPSRKSVCSDQLLCLCFC